MVAPFLMVAGVISSILLMDQLYRFIPFLNSIGMQISPILKMLMYSVPTIFVSTAPISMLLGTYITLNRLAMDSEIIAMRASGISLGFLYKPVISFSIVVAIIIGFISLWLNPRSATALEELKFNLIKYQSKLNITPRVINKIGSEIFFAFDKQEEELFDLFISNWDDPVNKPVIYAKKGQIDFMQDEQKVVMHLKDGMIHWFGNEDSHQVIQFDTFNYPVEFQSDQRKHLPQRFKDIGDSKAYKTDSELTISELNNVIEAAEGTSIEYHEYRTELHSRVVPPLACLTLTFLGLPIGIVNPRLGNRSGLLKILIVMIAFYVSYSKIYALSNDGVLSPYYLYVIPVIAIMLGIVYFLKANYDFENLKEIFRSIKS